MIRYKGFSDLVDRMTASPFACERTALLYFEDGGVRSLSWGAFARRIHARADELARSGKACEAILADGSLACVVEVFAAVHAGLQVALVDALVPAQVAVPLLNAVDADCVWTPRADQRAELESQLRMERPPACGAGAVLFFTSGTTSSSKAVVLTDASLMASAFNGSALMPLSPDDTLLCLLPLSHVFGFVCGLLWGLACGATVALGRGVRYYTADFGVFKPTAVALVPKLLQFELARGALNDELGLVLVGAADCSDELLDQVRQRGIRASLGYGLTETSSGVALSTGDDFHAMSICPDDTVSLADDGELLITAPTCMMRGYYRDDEKTAAALQNGVLHTGDLGYFDDEGLLHVKGRKKDVIALPSGTKVFVPDYEEELSAALGENDIAVMLRNDRLVLVCGALAHERTDNELLASIEPVSSRRPRDSRISAVVRLNASLPRTAAGDIERWKLQKELH